jgi:ribonuclease J
MINEESVGKKLGNGTLRLSESPIIAPSLPIPGKDEILVLPLGGCDAIGMNTTLYGHDGKWIIVDAGCMFVDEDEHPGVEHLVPDLKFLARHKESILGLVITHGHEDHLGGVQHLVRLIRPIIHATPFAAAIVRDRLEEHRLLAGTKFRTHAPGESFSIGPFRIETVRAAHSIPEATMLAISTPAGTVLHTGDWKFDPEPILGKDTDVAAIRRIAAKGVLAMACDSTNAATEGSTPSEAVVRDGFAKELAEHRGAVVVACFASNIARVKAIAIAARAAGRRVAVAGRSLDKMTGHARKLGHLAGVPEFVPMEEIGRLPRRQRLIICTGTQGEERAALGKIAFGQHRWLKVVEGDSAFFSARRIPGNEEAIDALQERLRKDGIDVVTPADAPIHVSGHPSRDDLRRLMRLVRPDCVLPIHGTPTHISQHAELAISEGAVAPVRPANGSLVALRKGRPPLIRARLRVGILGWDGKRLASIGADGRLVAEREKIAENATNERTKNERNEKPVAAKAEKTQGRRRGNSRKRIAA